MGGETFQSFSGVDSSKLKGALEGAICTLFFAPMMAVLFIGARMRALQMDPINGSPQKWAQNCFYMCAYAILAQTLLAVLVPLVMNGEAKFDDKGLGDVEFEVGNKMFGVALTICRYVVMLSIYVGFSVVLNE